jgi:hypothetical protein
MTWNNDAHGLVCKIPEAKLYLPSHSWAMKLSQLHKQGDTHVRIMTFSLNADMAQQILERRPYNIRIICNSQFNSEAYQLSRKLPGLHIRSFKDAHAKLVLIEPKTIYLGSANLVKNTLADISVGLRSKDAHDYYAKWFDEKFESCDFHRPFDDSSKIIGDFRKEGVSINQGWGQLPPIEEIVND